MNIRPATINDLQSMQNTNLTNLPENYALKYYLYLALSWPHGSFVATIPSKNGKNRIIGYVMAKIEDENREPNDTSPVDAHVISISVMRTYRRMGIAKKLLNLSLTSLRETCGARYVSLHVRKSNKAALHLYRDSSIFKVIDIETKYYADGEDAYNMRADLSLLDEEMGEKDEEKEEEEDLLDLSGITAGLNISSEA